MTEQKCGLNSYEPEEGEEKKFYIYFHPGDEQPKDLTGWEFRTLSNEVEDWINCGNRTFNYGYIHRKLVSIGEKREWLAKQIDDTFDTEEEKRAFYGMKAWPCSCPDGYRVIDFRVPEHFEYTLSKLGFKMHRLNDKTPVPIIEKIEPELPEITEETVLTPEMEYYGDGAEYYPIHGCHIGMTVGYCVSVHRSCGTITFRYIGKPDTEFIYTKPVEWVVPTDDDSRHRPVCQYKHSMSEPWLDEDVPLVAVICDNNGFFINMEGDRFDYCRMDIREREKYQ